ncbi:predicted polyketide synthase [Desulforapulum autotrophicum HRM2]|uniref:Predicted polyketide synthase n=1 Tax=Desulforapulum autotrophicum (strain ATCC 43914 / DSM 3382 / VKM B-1955 / HRM2) TaxID=177437 RepID=C0QLH0_DESAH|nr:type I polyketide synthase [Desulforapulum autotrophicum]ACN16274.1 predicted polyketide synthase [Desulforapulum autotrophicum HRM2]
MITRLFNSRLPLMVYNPAKVFSLDFFINAYRAGALPVFDTEFMLDHDILEGIKRLATANILFGVRVVGPSQTLLNNIKALDLTNLNCLVLPFSGTDNPDEFKENLEGFFETKIILEVREISMNKAIETVDPHGLVLRGNEACGRVSNFSAFILMQWYLKNQARPVIIHGGVGRYTAAGMFAAGVSGVVLDSQLWLSKQSPLSENFKKLLATVDESDSLEIILDNHTRYRVFAKLGTKIARDLKERAIILVDDNQAGETLYREIGEQLTALDDDTTTPVQSLFYLGQDAFFAKDFSRDSTDLDTIISTFFTTIGRNLDLVDRFDPMQPGTALAEEHGTRLPLIQGPMANITDNTDFANQVLEAGALPFFAVGSLPETLADTMLNNAHTKVKTFGAGLVGIRAFNPAIESHMEMVKKYKVPFALFAGGGASQAQALEKEGTKVYLHTPSISMLNSAAKNNCTRFILEGREAGGHVGSLSSLVLWEAGVSKLLNGTDFDLGNLSLVFAGGISTRYGSWFISGLASVLAEKGVKIGIQVGSAYLFSQEIVKTGSIKAQYQEIISKENETMVIGESVGLASRTAPNEFARMMIQTERQMIQDHKPLEQRKRSFEKRNIGSLLIGAKGFLPDFKKPGKNNFTYFEGAEQLNRGNFLVGESLAYFNNPISLADIHATLFDHKKGLIQNLGALEIFSSDQNSINDEIAVIGMGCVLPGAKSPEELWTAILERRYSIREMPETRMRRDLYYDADKSAEDKSYTLLAGQVEDYTFDHERFGYTPEKAANLSRSQQMLLDATYQAVEASGYLGKDNHFQCEDPERTAVIVATCLGNELGNNLQLKYHFPEIVAMLQRTEAYSTLTDQEKKTIKDQLQTGLEADNPGYDPVHGMLLNIEASRVAKHLGVRGTNYVVDAACASSFTAIDAAQGELLSGEVDQVIVGGVNTHLAPESFVGFCKMGALSAKGSFPFDERADGFVLGEGATTFILKRMKDAIRDKDNILGIIKSVGSSSDGKGKAIAAPNKAGQIFSLERCFERMKSDVKPSDIDFIEAHGTSTIMGDQAEIETLKNFYKGCKVGISSLKSQIGHLLGGAGAAGLAKAILAVKNGILPPNGQFKRLSSNHNLTDTDLYIIEEQKPWITQNNATRKAAVSAYGFGGINYHLVVEESRSDYQPVERSIFKDTDYDFNDDRIVMAGVGVCLPGAGNCEAFWERLESGEKQLSPIPEDRFSNDVYASFDKDSIYYLPKVKAGVITDFKFNNAKYRTPPKTVRSLERGQLFGLDAADEAITRSNLGPLLALGNRTGVILGTIPGERQNKNILRVRKLLVAEIVAKTPGVEKAQAVADELLATIRETIPANNEDTTPGLLSNIIAGRIANHFGLNGANYVVDASCASSVIAMRNGARSLRFKDLDYVLVGGVDANLYPAVLMAFKRLGLLSDDECNFFDSRAKGYVMGEGAAIHVLTTYKKARENNMPILAELNGITVKSSVPDHLLAPSENTFVRTINQCYQRTNIRKQEINHLDLFAFSNILGDMIERQVTEKCFTTPLYCGNVKPQFGYFKAANPAVALAKLALMNNRRVVLPDFNFSPDHSTMAKSKTLKHCDGMITIKGDRPVRFASNVNGIGGNHCHTIITTLPASLVKMNSPASDSTAVTAAIDIQAHPPATAVSYSADKQGKKQRIVALVSGQGSQRPGMMKALYEKNADIRRTMDQGEKIFLNERGYSLLEIMFGKDKRLNLTENTQPAVFLSSAALFHHLAAQGFNPDLFIGHSVGEYTALYCSGMLDFDDAMRLIIKRSDLMGQASLKHPGKIMVVFKNERDTATLIRESFLSQIYITNKNSENQTAVSGKADAIDAFCTFLAEKGVVHKRLDLSGAFHTPLFNEAARELREFLDTLVFNETRFDRIVSNVTARPYPENRKQVKDLLARQITSPVEFIGSIEEVYAAGKTHFIEIGPSRLLVNLLKNINIVDYKTAVTIDARKGEIESFKECKNYLKSINSIFTRRHMAPQPKDQPEQTRSDNTQAPVAGESRTGLLHDSPNGSDQIAMDLDFATFKLENKAMADKLFYEEYLRQQQEAAMDAVRRFNFITEPIVISGVSVGLPGKGKRVFAKDNFDQILAGTNFIEPLDLEDQKRITDKNITRLFKQPDGNARFMEITRTEDVIHLAGQLGYFDLTDEYGIKAQYDVSMSLAVAAGIEALKDAGIPLVMQYKKASTGTRMIPDGFALPKEMQEDTGIIITSLFPNSETLINEMEKYLYDKLYLKPYEAFENIYYYLMQEIKEITVKERLTDWFFKIKSNKRTDLGAYTFDRNFLANHCPLGAAHLAQIIRAKGPNTLVSSACASTTQAMGIAEDWIRVGRCKRVLVVGGENATSKAQNQWVGSGFLALGAATVKKRVSEAAKPFDTDRNGTILGSGAVGILVERQSTVKARGMNGQAEILGTHMANSAFHTFNIDVPHMASEMQRFIHMVEQRHNLKTEEYADKMLFMSHETYTPARGGSADAEVTALNATFKEHTKKICISNTKGFTGHTLGAAVEDVVLVKALQYRKAPPIANLKNIPDHFKELNFCRGNAIDAEYGLHLAAGFGSHFAFVFVRRIQENTFTNNPAYTAWLEKISESKGPELKIIDNTLCLVEGGTLPDLDGRKKATIKTGSPAQQDIRTETPDPLRQDRPMETTVLKESVQTAMPTATAASATGKTLETVKKIIAEQTGYTTDMLESDLDLEADLGIDTVKQVEIFAKAASHFGLSVPEDLKLRELNTIEKLVTFLDAMAGSDDTPAEVSSKPSTAEVTTHPSETVSGTQATETLETVKKIIAEQTGYTTDMLEPDLDLEADLGIDTVKQVEIFAKAASHFGLSVPEDLKLRELNTIAKLVTFLDAMAGPDDTPPEGGNKPSNDQYKATPSEASPGSQATDTVETVKEIIAEQTGYSTDMLEPDLDLEADLGIDTVKQVEIFAKAASHFGLDVPEDVKLRDLNTIAKLADHMAQRLNTITTAEKAPANQAPEKVTAPETSQTAATPALKTEDLPGGHAPLTPVKRLVVRTKETPKPRAGGNPFKGKTVVVTLDSHGFADSLIKAVAAKKGRVITLGPNDGADIKVDLADLNQVQQAVEGLTKHHKSIHGVIHLAHLDDYFNKGEGHALVNDLETNRAVKSLFVIIKALFAPLDRQESLIASLGFNSVVFPYQRDCGPIHPGSAGISGLLKTVAKEMSHTRVKFVDFTADPHAATVEKTIALFMDELCCQDNRCEVGFQGEKRHVLALDQQMAVKGASMIPKGGTLLVTGGARGITYEIMKQVVTIYGTDLIILGSSDIYALDPSFMAEGLGEPEIMALVKPTMPKARPLEIRQRVDRIVKMREAAANLALLESLGAKVTYHAVDVTDLDKVQRAIAAHERIDGVIHAAGVEMSQFIPKKTLTDFERVMDVKVKGMVNLLTAMADRDYRFFCTFSSVTARFGNEGQADYTAANDFITKLALEQQQLHPERKFKVYSWTAWSGAGMATHPTVMKVLEERGLQFLPLDQGIRAFMSDLHDTTDTEVVFSGLDYDFDRDGLLGDPLNPDTPFLDDMVSRDGTSLTFERTLDLDRDLFLLNHAMGDVPVFLGATGIETLVEVATALSSAQGLTTTKMPELSNFKIPYGIKILKRRPKELLISAAATQNDRFDCTITSQFKNPGGVAMGAPTRHYEGTLRFLNPPVEKERIDLPEFCPVTFDGELEEIVYHPNRLFMDGLFNTIVDVNSFDGTTLVTTVKDSSVQPFFKDITEPKLITPVVLIDAMFQTGGLLEFFTSSQTVLPYAIGRMTVHGKVEKGKPYFCITTKSHSDKETNTYQLQLVDDRGNLFVEVVDFQMVRLNKLAEEDRIAHRITFGKTVSA